MIYFNKICFKDESLKRDSFLGILNFHFQLLFQFVKITIWKKRPDILINLLKVYQIFERVLRYQV